MDFKVFLSDDALNDLERIVAYIAPHNPFAAERMGNELLDAALSLKTLPERGRVVPEFRRPELREIIFRFEYFREEARNNRDLGDKFERLIAAYLTKDPYYATHLLISKLVFN